MYPAGRVLWTFLPPLLVVLVAIAAYANARPNALVHDDKFYGGSERYAALTNIPRYFTEGVWASNGIDEPLYRPLLLLSVTLDARVWGDRAAGYHLTNIVLHAIVAVLMFIFLRRLLSRGQGAAEPGLAAALAVALIFAVHPVNTEVVNSVFNRSEALVALGGLAGLWWFLRWLDPNPARAWTGLGLAYLFALFSKESAIVLPGIAVVLALGFSPGNLRARIRKCLPVLWLLLPLALYVVLRARALAPAELQALADSLPEPTLLSGTETIIDEFRAPSSRRVMDVFGFWYEAIRILLWPHPLSVAPVLISPFARLAGLALNLGLVAVAVYQATRRRYGLLAGLAIFYLASLPASRLIGDPGVLPHLAERYLYFPSVGLAIALGFGLRFVARRYGSTAAVAAVLPVLIAFMPLTLARNADWASDLALYESEYRNGAGSEPVLIWLTAAHLTRGKFRETAELCDRVAETRQDARLLSSHCAIAYSRMGRLQEAEAAHLFAASGKRAQPIAHANLAQFYLTQGRWRDAKLQFEQAIGKEKIPASRALRTGQMLMQLYPWDRDKLEEARDRFEEALELQPSFRQAEQWLARVNRLLGA